METIFALASAPGKAGVAVVRISGPKVPEILAQMAPPFLEPRVAGLRRLKDRTGGFLDEALVLRFEEGSSFTGEAVAELHLHGSVAVVSAVLTDLAGYQGCRSAEPGEFTRRALESGRLDLTQVEALSDLIEAETEAQRLQALEVLSGALRDRVGTWREKIVRALALLEATIDFADEDVPEDVTPEVCQLIADVQTDLRFAVAGAATAERVRTGFEVAIVGPPNIGKSTLLNYLAGRDAAITSEIAGTTRDVIEVRMDLDGLPVTILDTAGIRETTSEIELIGIERARHRALEADVRIHLWDLQEEPLVTFRNGDVLCRAKADLSGDANGISAITGQGVDRLISELVATLKERVSHAGLANRVRHVSALNEALTSLSSAESLMKDGSTMYDIASEEIRLASRALEALLGYVDVEDLLDHIFANFCIGK